MKKILWVNRSFLDYRVPLYKELFRATDGNFSLIYSKVCVPDRCRAKVKSALGDFAIELEEKRIAMGESYEFANAGLSITIPKGLLKKMRDIKPDVIIAEGFGKFTPWALWYAICHRLPILIAYERTAHTERKCPKWRMLYRKFLMKFVTGYIANGSLTKDYLVSLGARAESIFTGGMCADSNVLALSVAAMSEDEKSAFEENLIGVSANTSKDESVPCGLSYVLVGRMIALKGVNYALEGWLRHIAKYPNDHIILVGDGPLLDEYKDKYGSEKSIVFVGGVDYSEVYKYYAVSDVFVIATLEDNWSLVVPEAMACGLPVACSIYNGCHPELVKSGVNGIIFDPLDKASVVNVFEYFHNANLESMGRESVRMEKDYDPESVARNILGAADYAFSKR